MNRRSTCRRSTTAGLLASFDLLMALPFVRCLCAGKHLPEETATSLKVAQDVELHQLTSRSRGSTPTSRLRNAVRHAPKATDPRAMAPTNATSPIAFNIRKNSPYQPFTNTSTDSFSRTPNF